MRRGGKGERRERVRVEGGREGMGEKVNLANFLVITADSPLHPLQ